MKQWKNILQRDDYIVSFKGLDSLALKPEIPSEQKPVFRLGYEGGLVCRRELRTEEEYLKDFTPFVNKKTSEYLEAMRKAWFEPNGLDDSVYDMFFGNARTEADAVEEEEEFIHDDWASLFSGAEVPLSTVASDIRGILERHEPSSEAHAMVGGGGSAAAAAAGELLPSRGYEDLEARRAELERTAPILQQISEIQERIVSMRQPLPEGRARVESVNQAMIEKLEAKLVVLYQSIGKTPGEAKAMLRQSHIELRVVSQEVWDSPEFKDWSRYLTSQGLESKKDRVNYARSIGVGPKFIAHAGATSHGAIIKGLIEAGKRAPPRASMGGGGGSSSGGGSRK